MTLSSDEREILQRVAASTVPVQPSDYFHEIHAPDFPTPASDDDPRWEAWAEKQIGLHRAMLRLHDLELIRVVEPANGERGDLMEATRAGIDALG